MCTAKHQCLFIYHVINHDAEAEVLPQCISATKQTFYNAIGPVYDLFWLKFLLGTFLPSVHIVKFHCIFSFFYIFLYFHAKMCCIHVEV